FLYPSPTHRDLHSFPTRRSSDLRRQRAASMPVNTQAIGKTYDPVLYAVGREKIREYARAVGETNPVHLDLDAARAAGHADLVAPDRKSTRLNSSHLVISYAVFCL